MRRMELSAVGAGKVLARKRWRVGNDPIWHSVYGKQEQFLQEPYKCDGEKCKGTTGCFRGLDIFVSNKICGVGVHFWAA